jgi:hypothetical protein
MRTRVFSGDLKPGDDKFPGDHQEPDIFCLVIWIFTQNEQKMQKPMVTLVLMKSPENEFFAITRKINPGSHEITRYDW